MPLPCITISYQRTHKTTVSVWDLPIKSMMEGVLLFTPFEHIVHVCPDRPVFQGRLYIYRNSIHYNLLWNNKDDMADSWNVLKNKWTRKTMTRPCSVPNHFPTKFGKKKNRCCRKPDSKSCCFWQYFLIILMWTIQNVSNVRIQSILTPKT